MTIPCRRPEICSLRRGRGWVALLTALLGPTLLGAETVFPTVQMKLAYPELILHRPLFLCEAPDGSKRIFVVEQGGKILVLPQERTGKETKVFLDISDRKPHVANEEGLLGLAFHPQLKSNGKFFIHYSQQNPRRNVLSEIQVAKDNPDRADPATERILTEIPQPYANHNGGAILFGPDGFLYVSLGDGGSANDPLNSGQNLFSLLGKILRIDVNSRTGNLPYGIPADNPFAGKDGARHEVWAYGLRNIWRMSFDRQTGELWGGDVGQNKWEEVDVIVKGGNYGWRIREGLHAFETNPPPAEVKWIDPVFEYGRTNGNSITGGYVYRGQKNPGLRGLYLCADFTTGTIFALRYEAGKVTQGGVLFTQSKGLIPLRNISSFGEDAGGELYILTYEGIVNGRIYELEEITLKAEVK